MNAKELLEWLEERGEMMLSKQDGKGFVIAARAADGIWKPAEAETLEHAVITWEEM